MSTHLYRSRDDRMLAGVAGGLAELWDADPSLVRIIWALLVVLTGGIALVVYIVMALVVPEEDDVRTWGGQASTWDARSASPVGTPAGTAADGTATAPTPAPGVAGSPDAGAAAFTDAPPVASGAPGLPPPPPSPVDWRQSRFEAREGRRIARSEARAARQARRGYDGRSGAVIVGILFILIGTWYLVRQYLPEVDWDWFWPLTLVALGVVVLVFAVRPRPDDPGPGGADGSGGA